MDVVITIHNPPPISIECIKSLLVNKEGIQKIIIIDNASTDLTNVPDIKAMADVFITLKTQVSIAATWNVGIALSKEDLVLISNDDIFFTKNFAQPLQLLMEYLKTIGVLQPYNTLGEVPENFPKNYVKDDRVGEIPRSNFIGCCFVIRKSLLPQLKEFDKKTFTDWDCGSFFYEKFYPFGPEDQDFYRRVRAIGFDTLTYYGSYVHHLTGQTMQSIPDFEELKEQGNQIFNERWHGKI